MAWFSDLAGKAESLLNNLDEQTGAALQRGIKKKSSRASDCSPPPSYVNLENPPWNSNSKRRPLKSPPAKKPITEIKSNYSNRKSPPSIRQSRALVKEIEVPKEKPRMSKSPGRKSLYSLNNCPATLVSDMKAVEPVETLGLRRRRFNSLPTDLDTPHNGCTLKMQNLEVENAMLKNELNVMNKEVTDLLDRLAVTEDGNDVVYDQEIHKLNMRLKSSEFLSDKVETDKTLATQLEALKRKVNNLTSVEMAKQREQTKDLQFEIDVLRKRNQELEELIRQANDQSVENDSVKSKLENELKHAQTTIGELESNLEKTTAECQRLESEWDSYKLRVKSMLFNKDKEIKALQEGLNLTEDTKILIEQIEMLKDEREELSEAVSHIRGECHEMRRHLEEMEARRDAAERVVAALRDALRDEREARTRAEAQCTARRKELKEIENDTNLKISSLRATLREKDNEITRLREMSVRSADTSALNVADYDAQESINNDKIHYLTQTLVQKQGKIDLLLADNNLLRIQMEKIESKYRSELLALRSQARQSVVNIDSGRRGRAGDSAPSALSRLGLLFTRRPVRVFVMFYMLGLHFWVLTVLLTSTPDSYLNYKQKTIPNG